MRFDSPNHFPSGSLKFLGILLVRMLEEIGSKIFAWLACHKTPASTVMNRSAGEFIPSTSILSRSCWAFPDSNMISIAVASAYLSKIGSINWGWRDVYTVSVSWLTLWSQAVKNKEKANIWKSLGKFIV